MGLLKLLERLVDRLADESVDKSETIDDTDLSAAPRLQHPEQYDNIDLWPTAAGFPSEAGGSWHTGGAPIPAYPRMSRRQAREWARLRAQDAARQRKEGAE